MKKYSNGYAIYGKVLRMYDHLYLVHSTLDIIHSQAATEYVVDVYTTPICTRAAIAQIEIFGILCVVYIYYMDTHESNGTK